MHSRADFNSVIISFNGDVCKVSFTIYSLECVTIVNIY